MKKIIFGILLHVVAKMENIQLALRMIQQLRVIKSQKKQKQIEEILLIKACKIQNFYVLLAILSIAIALLIAVDISCYLVKYRANQKHLLPFHDTNNELKQVLY